MMYSMYIRILWVNVCTTKGACFFLMLLGGECLFFRHKRSERVCVRACENIYGDEKQKGGS